MRTPVSKPNVNFIRSRRWCSRSNGASPTFHLAAHSSSVSGTNPPLDRAATDALVFFMGLPLCVAPALYCRTQEHPFVMQGAQGVSSAKGLGPGPRAVENL